MSRNDLDKTLPLAKSRSAGHLSRTTDSGGNNRTQPLPSFAALCEDYVDPEPGPGSYEMPSCFGHQVESTKQSGQEAPILAKNAHSWSKVFIDKNMSCEFLCTASPGAVYHLKPTLSKVAVKFSRGKRADPASKSESPGPVYHVETKIGACRSTKFAQGSRFLRSRSAEPGNDPGKYSLPGCLDGEKQAKTFGESFAAYEKVYQEGADKAFMGKASPGPGSYKCDFGRKLPQYHCSGRTVFSKAPQHAKAKKTIGQGPGAYNNHEVNSVARLTCCDSKVWNYPAHNFGKPSLKPRLDFKRLRQWENSTWGLNT